MNDHVLITGGSRGIGAATVLEFARAGYDVAFTWNSREDAALDVVQQAQALNPGGRFVALHADVSDSAQVNAAVQEALQQFGSLQVLMCCAGIAQQKLFTDLTDEDWHRMMGVDLDGVFYAVMGLYISGQAFNYLLYLIFVLAVGTISVFYRLAYDAWYPNLIPNGMEQKGYAVSNTIYPLVIIAMSPAATFLYEKISMAHIFYLVSGITMVSVIVESRIHEEKEEAQDDYTWKQYCQDIREGFHYLKKEKGIRNIYTYMSITSGVSDGNTVLIQAFYQTVPWLTVTMLGFLKSAEMIGRGLGGIFQYKKEIPVKKRYAFTKFVYTVYGLMDILLLYLPYPLMLCNRFLCGALGISSATIRETAVQSYLPENMRARINAFFNMVFAIGSVAFQMAAGALGQIMSYRFAILLLATIELTAMFLLICLPAKENRPVYEAVRNAE